MPVFAQRANILNIYYKQLDNCTLCENDRNVDKMCFMYVILF